MNNVLSQIQLHALFFLVYNFRYITVCCFKAVSKLSESDETVSVLASICS